MPALISITKVRVTTLPSALHGTPGFFRVKFWAGKAEVTETIPKAEGSDGSVEWSETLEIVVQDVSVPLQAGIEHKSTSAGGWGLVPGGNVVGAVVTELPSEWRDEPPGPYAPTFYAQLSVIVEHSIQHDTLLPPFAGVYTFGEGSSGLSAGGRGGGGGGGFPAGTKHDDDDDDDDDGTRPPPCAGKDRRGALTHGENLSPTSSTTSSSTLATSSVGGGFFQLEFDADPSEASAAWRRAHALSTPARTGHVAPTPTRREQAMSMPLRPQRGLVSMRRAASGGWWSRESSSHRQAWGFNPNLRIPEFGAGTMATSSAMVGSGAPEPEPGAEPDQLVPADAPLASPVGSYFPSLLLDPLQEEEEEEEKGKPDHALQVEKKKWGGFSSHGSQEEEEEEEKGKPDSAPQVEKEEWGGFSSHGSPAAAEAPDSEDRMVELQTQRRSRHNTDVFGNAGGAPTPSFPAESPLKQKWFHRLKRSSSSGSKGFLGSTTFSGAERGNMSATYAVPWASLDERDRVPAGLGSSSPPIPLEPSGSKEKTTSKTAGGNSASPKTPWPSGITRASSESTPVSDGSVFYRLQGRWKRAVRGASQAWRGGGLPCAKEDVVFSCFAPLAVRPGFSFALKVSAYLKTERDAALREAMSRAAEGGGMSISKGKRVTVQLLLPEKAFKVLASIESTAPVYAQQPSVRDFVWTGENHVVEFRVGCLAGVAPGYFKCEAMVIEGSRVKRLTFAIEVAESGFVPRALDGGSNGEVELNIVMEEERGNVAEIPFDELVFVRELGSGVQGITSHCQWRGEDVAVKSLASLPAFNPSRGSTRSDLEHEATVLSLLGRHPNIVEFYGLGRQGGGSCRGDEGSVHVVTKLAEGGSIEAALGVSRGDGDDGRFAAKTNRSRNSHGLEFDGNVRAAWAGDIARGLANSHAAGVLHNDVASRNALLSTTQPGGRGLLCDFSLSRFLRGGVEAVSLIDTERDAHMWPVRQMPRECLEHPFPLTTKSDSWMYGLFLYEVFEGRKPWAGLDNLEVRRLVMEGKRPPKVPDMLKERGSRLVKLYTGCLDKDSAKRPSLEQVVQYFSPILPPPSSSSGAWEGFTVPEPGYSSTPMPQEPLDDTSYSSNPIRQEYSDNTDFSSVPMSQEPLGDTSYSRKPFRQDYSESTDFSSVPMPQEPLDDSGYSTIICTGDTTVPMPQESLGGSGRVDASLESLSPAMYPQVRPREHLESSESKATTASETINNTRVSRSTQLPSQSTTPDAHRDRNVTPEEDALLRVDTLARSLGPLPSTFTSSTYAVELELEAGSLAEEVPFPVKITPSLEFVECRTEGSGRAPFSGHAPTEEFLAMTFVHGPKEAVFHADRPAKLRYFVGYADEFERGDGSDQAVEDSDIERYIGESCRPLTSPDGQHEWTVLEPYSAVFRLVDGQREVWAETPVRHFSKYANGVRIEGYNDSKHGNRTYYYGDMGGFLTRIRRKGASAMPKVRFGNATQEIATFTSWPIVQHTDVADERESSAEIGAEFLASIGGGMRRQSSASGVALAAAQEPVTTIVLAGGYEDCDLTCDIRAHLQMHVKIGVLRNMETGTNGTKAKGALQLLDLRRMSGNKILVLRQPRLDAPSMYREIEWPCTNEEICAL